MVEEVISENTVKLLVSIIIHLIVNVSKVVRYKELIKEQRVEEPKPVKVDKVEKWEMNNVLNKRKVKRFIAENYILSDIQSLVSSFFI